jgi:competence protein ComEA
MRGATEEIPLAPEGLSVTEAVAQVTVDVAGAIKNPGVYTLPANSRVMDAIKAAGDKLKGADLSDINLARIIKDGEQIYIYPPGKTGSAMRISPQRAKAKISGPITGNTIQIIQVSQCALIRQISRSLLAGIWSQRAKRSLHQS